jgi:phage gp36-like protein
MTMSDRVTIEFDDREFQRALALYLSETGKSVADVVNKKALFICLHASKDVPIGNVKDDYTRESKLFNAVATGGTRLGVHRKGVFVKGDGNAKAAKKIFGGRARAKGYSRFVWLKMAGELGGKSGKSSSRIEHAKATKAKPSIRPFATLAIEGLEQKHVDKIMEPALQRAVDKEAASMMQYLADRQAKVAAKRSSRR